MRVLIIAEAGVNHDGDLGRALALVDAAAAAGADVVKFQTFRASEIVSVDAPKAAYQTRNTSAAESQLAMLQRLELSEDAHRALIARCAEKGIAFLSTPFDMPSLAFLTDGLGLTTLKVPSGEITNAPLLYAAARTNQSIILSTGMSTLSEVEQALGVLAHGYLGRPTGSAAAFAAAYADPAGQAVLREKVVLLHCTTEYPAPMDQVNLRAMQTLREAFGLPVGFSDHTTGIAAATAATALGATVIEKHFTLDKTLPGPDHKASLEPDELAALVASIRAVELALGDAAKGPTAAEAGNLPVARKSLVALSSIRAGDVLTAGNMGVKRPGDGISPMSYWDYLGRTASRTYAPGERIAPEIPGGGHRVASGLGS